MLSYDAPGPATKGSKDAPATASMPPLMANDASTTTTASRHAATTYKHHHIWLVTGPAGCGKTTVAEHLSKALDMPYIEGDSYHPPANIEKMANGVPLTDADRWDWLTALRQESMQLISGGAEGVVLTCSALKRKYRDVIRVAAYNNPTMQIHFLYLDASEEVLLKRVAARKGHYMGANMVSSQFSILERPQVDETDIMSVDVSKTMEEVMKESRDKVLAYMEEDKA